MPVPVRAYEPAVFSLGGKCVQLIVSGYKNGAIDESFLAPRG